MIQPLSLIETRRPGTKVRAILAAGMEGSTVDILELEFVLCARLS